MPKKENLNLEIMTIQGCLRNDLKHYEEQKEFIQESIDLAESLTGDDFSNLLSLKQQYFDKQKEILILYKEMEKELFDLEKEIKKKEWQVYIGGTKNKGIGKE